MAIDFVPHHKKQQRHVPGYGQQKKLTKRPQPMSPKKRTFGVDNNRNKAATTTPDLLHRVLTKMAFGPSDELVNHVNQLPGANTQAKIMAYINEQLNPDLINDSACNQMLTSANGFTTLNKSRQQLFQEHARRPDGVDIPWPKFVRPIQEVIYAAFIRGIHSKRQLLEMMADFWHNHFNIYSDAYGVQPMFVHYDRDVIRANALGNFRQMLYQVTRSTCMLIYLNNGSNEQSAPNENYAREVMELHTLGAENYLGHMNWQDVPSDSQGRRVGYVEEDVMEMARALTGWSFSGADWWDYQNGNIATGLFQYRDGWHDKGAKRVLGEYFDYSAAQPQSDLNQILDLLAEHPGTNRFLAEKLCRRFIADEPPTDVVDAVATTLHNHWQSPDQIKLAMQTLLTSDAFLNTWGDKVKRPFERTISAMRQLQYSFPFNPEEEISGWHFWVFLDTGHLPFSWAAPNGYPDVKSHWLGASSMMATWTFTQWIAHFHEDNDGEKPILNSVVADTFVGLPNANEHSAYKLVDFWYQKIIGAPPNTETRDHLAQFMASTDRDDPIGGDANAPIDLNTNVWPSYNQDRLYAMVSCIFFTPEFMDR